MRYLITTNNSKPYLTNYYEYDKHYNLLVEMAVYDLENCEYTVNGINWKPIEIDNL